MRVSLIVAAGANRVIGRDGALPWRLPADLRHFRRVTTGKPVIMGRRTWESIGGPLPGRPCIVVTRNPEFRTEGARIAGSLEEALGLAAQIARGAGEDEVMVIGGEEIFRLALPRADRIYLTEIDIAPDGDTRFPELDPGEWREIAREDHPAGEDTPAYSFVVLERTDD